MGLKYRNFKRLSNAGPVGGFDGVLTLLFVAALCGALAFFAWSNLFFRFLLGIPALVCIYAAAVELRGLTHERSDDGDS